MVKNGLFIFKNGDQIWFANDRYHRLNGPAFKCDFCKCWYKNGIPNRVGGPTIEWSDGKKDWYHQGKWVNCYSQKEFERYVNLLPFA